MGNLGLIVIRSGTNCIPGVFKRSLGSQPVIKPQNRYQFSYRIWAFCGLFFFFCPVSQMWRVEAAGLCFPCRHCCPHLCPADVCQDGHFPGDTVQEIWEALQGSPVLQRESPPLLDWAQKGPHTARMEPALIFPSRDLGWIPTPDPTLDLFFSPQHALPLPGFLLLAPNIYQHAVLFNQSGECCAQGSVLLGFAFPLENPSGKFPSCSCAC